MHTYSSQDHNQTDAFYRLANKMDVYKELGFTLIVGAGCSFTASDKGTTASDIMLRCLQKQYPDYEKPNRWEPLYADFIEKIWNTSGKRERRDLLQKELESLTLSEGYKNLKLLLENGYIKHIITTNFDMLLDQTLEGLPHTVQVSNLSTRDKGTHPVITLLKVHGDIESGEIKFSQKELMRLPQEIKDIITHRTELPTLVIGYSGQDIGLMEALSNKDDYSVFWVDPIKSDEADIYDWMKQRHSTSNYIYGQELGTFDGLMARLVNTLFKKNSLNEASSLKYWENSTIFQSLKLNQKVYSIFENILKCNETIMTGYTWTLKPPFYSENYVTTLNAFLYFYKSDNGLPESFLQVPENEIEALLLGTSIDIFSRSSGLNTIPIDFCENLIHRYEKSDAIYKPWSR